MSSGSPARAETTSKQALWLLCPGVHPEAAAQHQAVGACEGSAQRCNCTSHMRGREPCHEHNSQLNNVALLCENCMFVMSGLHRPVTWCLARSKQTRAYTPLERAIIGTVLCHAQLFRLLCMAQFSSQVMQQIFPAHIALARFEQAAEHGNQNWQQQH